jgi:cytosolic 5'-nucleotidase 3
VEIMENVIIPDPEKLEVKKEIFKKEGRENIHILSDFDRTITKIFVNGERVNSLMSHMRKNHGEYLTEDYAKKSKELEKKYFPIENDPLISLEIKKKEMESWWKNHSQLLINSGLQKSDFKKLGEEPNIQLRENFDKFTDLTRKEKIPLIIFSSSGIGETIPIILKNKGIKENNIKYIINRYEFNNNGKAIRPIMPIIHVFNKDETAINSYPEIYKEIENKKNVILIGDSLGDLGMVKGFDYNEIIKIGFLNDDIEKNLESYKKNFDIIITNDGSFEEITKTLKEILNIE